MTISSTTSKWTFTGDNSTTIFAYDNKILATTDLKVYLDAVLQSSGYTVSGAGDAGGGNVTFTTAPGTSVSVVIVRDVPSTQATDYPVAGAFPAVSTEDALDKLTILIQQAEEVLARCLQFTSTETATYDSDIPTPSSGKILSWNSLGALVNTSVTDITGLSLNNETQLFSTYAAMIAGFASSTSNFAMTAGYNSEGDGGTGLYYYDSSSSATEDSFIYGDPTTESTGRLILIPFNGEYNGKQAGMVADASTDNATAFDRATAGAANALLVIPSDSSNYVMSGTNEITSPITIRTHGATLDWTTDSASQGLKVSSSDVHIIGGEWKGPTYASYDATQIGIWFEGTNPSTYITNCSIRHAEIHNWGGSNVRLRMTQYFDVSNCSIYNGRANGVAVLSCLDGVINNNLVYNFDGDSTPQAWGITLSKNNGAISSWPLTERVIVSNNVVRDIIVWTALDTHGATDCVFSDNIVYDCKLGLVITRFDDGSDQYGPKRIIATGNVIRNNSIAKADVANGIQVVGASSSETADNIVIVGNSIHNMGKDQGTIGTNNFSSSVYMSRFSNVTFSDNILEDGGTHGLQCDIMVGSLNGSNNIIRNLTDGATGSAIYFDGDGEAADGCLTGTIIDVAGYIGVYCQAQTDMDMINTKFQAASTNWDQNGGVLACQYLGRVDPVHIGSDTGWTPSIADAGTETRTISSIPGCSAECIVEAIGYNRDLLGLDLHYVTGSTDTNSGDVDIIAYNYTGATRTVAGSLTIPYKIIKPS